MIVNPQVFTTAENIKTVEEEGIVLDIKNVIFRRVMLVSELNYFIYVVVVDFVEVLVEICF